MKNITIKFMGFMLAALLPFAMANTAHAQLNDGLAGYWTFDEGVGVIANDVSGNLNNGSIVGGASYVAGKVGTNALNFDGSSAYLDAPDSASLDIAGDFSIGAWVKPNAASLSGLVGIASKDGSSSRAYALILNNGKVEGYFSSDGALYTGDLVGATALAAGVWTHIAVTRTGATLKVFVNGVLDATATVPTTAVYNSPDSLVVGARLAGVGLFTGDVDDVKVYNRALADCEVGRLAGSNAQCLVPTIKTVDSPSAQYPLIDPELQQDIVADNQHAGSGSVGMAWLANGDMIRRLSNQIIEYSVDQTRNIFGTPVYDIVATHVIPGLDGNGNGITNGTDGYIYANAVSGLYRIDPATWTAVRVGLNGYYHGISALPDGRIVNQASGGNLIYIYDPSTGVQSLLYNPGTFIDDLTTTDTGYVLLADYYGHKVRVIDSNGNFINAGNIHTSPDGMAYGDGSIYSANVDGTISRTDFSGPNFTGTATETIVASGGYYGDLSSVGPDGSFYISTNGLHYDNGVSASGWGIVKISKAGGFSTPPGVPSNKPPVADAGAAQTVECTGSSSANATLNGSASHDPDAGDVLTYSWAWTGGSATGVSPTASFPLGTTNVTLTVDDGQGHTDTASTTVTVQDTTAPVVNAGADVTLEATSTSGAAYDVSAQSSATDSCCTTAMSVSPSGPYALGSTSVTVSATDCSGNTGSDTMVVTVVDTTPPALTPPGNLTVEANAVSSTVAIGTATATDIFPVTITSNAPATYPLGTTLVTWTATDDNGNISTATQSITVQDTTPPVLTPPGDVTAEANAVNSTVAIGTATATDIFPVTITSDAPATFPLGTTLVTWTATDDNGNVSTATQSITVQDTTPPVLTLPADVTVEATGVLTPVAIGTATGTDIFLPVTITNDAPASYSLGTTLVTWTATDANGNVSSATQSITVQDTTPPTVTAQLIPVSGGHDEDDNGHSKGLFTVVFTATDLVDPNPAITATLNGATVTNGQVVKLERSKKAEVETEHGRLEISGLSFTLSVSATDASGNVGTAAASYAFPSHKGDDNGIHRGNDKEDKHADKGNHKSEGKAKVEHKDSKKGKKHG